LFQETYLKSTIVNKVKLNAPMPKKPLLSATQTHTSPETTQTSNIHNQATIKKESTHPTITLQTIDSNTSKDSTLSLDTAIDQQNV